MSGHRIGVLSDTHGLLRPEVLAALAGCEHILHAGDVGGAGLLEELAAIAPVTAVRGNIDRRGPSAGLAARELVEIDGATFYLLHDLGELDLDPAAAGFAAVISGHSHRPSIEHRRGVLYLNPGSCGPRRFSLPVTVAVLTLGGPGPALPAALETPSGWAPRAALPAAPRLEARIIALACP